MSGYFYVMRDGASDAYKLGVTSKNAEDRRRQLQTGNPRDLTVLYEFRCNDPYAIEGELHDIFADREIPTGGDEWFRFKYLSNLHVELNRLVGERRIVSTGRYGGNVNYWELIKDSYIWVPVLFLLLVGVVFSIWSGMFL